MRRVLIALLRAYQYALSPWWGGHCRFLPTCSHFAVEAIDRHGAAKGGAMAMARLCRCHPWADGGFDPVPRAGDAPQGR